MLSYTFLDKFPPQELDQIVELLAEQRVQYPLSNMAEYLRKVRRAGHDVRRTWLQELFVKFQWTPRIVDRKSWLKFLPLNLLVRLDEIRQCNAPNYLQKYQIFYEKFLDVDKAKLHYVDEASFNSQGMDYYSLLTEA